MSDVYTSRTKSQSQKKNDPTSKSEAISAVDELLAFAAPAALAFADLVSRVKIFRESVIKGTDPVQDRLIENFAQMVEEFAVAVDKLK